MSEESLKNASEPHRKLCPMRRTSKNGSGYSEIPLIYFDTRSVVFLQLFFSAHILSLIIPVHTIFQGALQEQVIPTPKRWIGATVRTQWWHLQLRHYQKIRNLQKVTPQQEETRKKRDPEAACKYTVTLTKHEGQYLCLDTPNCNIRTRFVVSHLSSLIESNLLLQWTKSPLMYSTLIEAFLPFIGYIRYLVGCSFSYL